MITLYTFGPAFDLPDPSPFVMKAQVLLKMAGQPFRTDTSGFRKAPKGKMPYLQDDDGTLIADSTFIRFYLEKKYAIDFDEGLSAEQRAVAWAFEKMAEDHMYWMVVHARWMDDANFARGPAQFFRGVPGLIRSLVIRQVRGRVRKDLWSQGIGRHSGAEIAELGGRSLGALADGLGTKPFFMGTEPTGVDATIFAMLAGLLCPLFDTPLRTMAEQNSAFRSYVDRMMARFFPERTQPAGSEAAA